MRMWNKRRIQSNLDQMYATSFAKGATVTTSSTRQNHLYKEKPPRRR